MIGPKARVRLDGADPINRGLFYFPSLADAAGSIAYDLSSYRLSAARVGSASSVITPAGRVTTVNGSAGYVLTTVTDLSFPSGSVSWWQNTPTTYYSGLIRAPWGITTVSGEFSAQVYTDNNWYIGWRNGGTDTRVIVAASPANWPTNTDTFYIFTWSPAGSALYCNNVLVGTNAAAPALSNLASAFCIGRQGSSSSAGLAANIWRMRIHRRVLLPAERARLYRDPWAGTARRVRPVYYSTGGGGVTVALTGQSIASGQGSVGTARAILVAGQAVAFGQGGVIAARAQPVTGQVATTGQGAVAPEIASAIAGQAVSSAQGALSPTAEISATGQSATFAQGATQPSISAGLSGQSAVTGQGAAVPNISSQADGQSSAFAQGAFATSRTVGVSGQAAVFGQGVLGAGGDITLALVGQSLTAGHGAVATSATALLAGQTATAMQGSLGSSRSLPFTGQFGTFAQGNIVVSGAITAALTGQVALFGQGAVTPSVVYPIVLPPASRIGYVDGWLRNRTAVVPRGNRTSIVPPGER